MSTVIRPVISEKKQYWIERHRYYELKHFCLQYPVWKKALAAMSPLTASRTDAEPVADTNEHSDPTEEFVVSRLYYTERINLVERVAKETYEPLQSYLVKSVTEGLSYETLMAKAEEVPCCGKDFWYAMYRRFFWLLDKARG